MFSNKSLAGQQGLEPGPTGRRPNKKFHNNKLWNFLYLLPKMVRECDVRWNTIEASLTLLYTKMRDLGFSYDGQNVVRPSEEEANV
jgi:hypothetical protein